MKKNELLAAIESTKTRSAWERGVKEYAVELVENLDADDIPECRRDLEKLLLSGAETWDDYSINPETLKAVKVSPDEWEKLNKAASVGVGNLKAAEKALKNKRRGYWSDRKRAAAELAISIFCRICE